MNAAIPESWREVNFADFKIYLEDCPDYRTTGYCNGIVFYWRDNEKRFAIELNDKRVLVDPSLLEPQPK